MIRSCDGGRVKDGRWLGGWRLVAKATEGELDYGDR
jgi:hypothetical protein